MLIIIWTYRDILPFIPMNHNNTAKGARYRIIIGNGNEGKNVFISTLNCLLFFLNNVNWGTNLIKINLPVLKIK